MFFKNRKKKDKTIASEVLITEDERKVIEQRILQLEEAVQKTSKNDEKIDLFNQLGLEYEKISNIDKAIENFEDSLLLKEQFGEAYNNLLNLYEEKRKNAAKLGEDEEIQKWLTKTEDLMNMAKKVMKSKM